MVVATVGDTLRIVNDDTVTHRLHTQNGRPFPHPANDIFPGDSADFVLETTYDPDAEGPLTDHDQGPTALCNGTAQDHDTDYRRKPYALRGDGISATSSIVIQLDSSC